MEKKGFQQHVDKILENANTTIQRSSNTVTNTEETDDNEQPNEPITSINQGQPEIEINGRPNIPITSIIQAQQQIEEIRPETNAVQEIPQTGNLMKTPKLLREIKMRDRTQKCPHTQYSFFCYCKRPQLSNIKANENKKIPITRTEKNEMSTNSIDRILKTYGTTYGENNTCLPNEFYPLVLRKFVDIPNVQNTSQTKTTEKRMRNVQEEEISQITQLKLPLDAEITDEIFEECESAIDNFNTDEWFHKDNKDKVNN